MRLILTYFTIFILFNSCSCERCRINHKINLPIYEKAVEDIHKLGLKMDSNENHSKIAKTIYAKDSLISAEVFSEIELVECHEDGTIIFQAFNCNTETSIRDEYKYFISN